MKQSINHVSRRAALRTGLAIFAAGGLATAARAQDEKLAQNIVQYQETPKDGAMCSTCVNFVEPNACKIVAGNHQPEGLVRGVCTEGYVSQVKASVFFF